MLNDDDNKNEKKNQLVLLAKNNFARQHTSCTFL